ncbi:CHAT domain-containing protein [Fodinibius halophilus]|uniref:CHAT domain-containing protein n=1 Tax=Fodinibius halophilus TaxID=1736908 RepID=A0A6M1T6W2_9BACT|nr:CHAT domain-containing tetratricopeptide repeat protein [Fodinibius halophilus]NGP88383.1 CHAT domain-containing protein [Fodinibius halophilus]
MLFAFFLCFLQLVSASEDTTLFDDSKLQTNYYIEQIQNERNVEKNIWALTLVATSSEELKRYVENTSASKKQLSLFTEVEQNYQDQIKKIVFSKGFPGLFIAYLLSLDDKSEKESAYNKFTESFELPHSGSINYPEVAQAIIKNREISPSILPSQTFSLLHFFLLFDSNRSTYLSNEYLKAIFKSWHIPTSDRKELTTTILEASYFRVLYLLDKYSQTNGQYQSLIKSNLFPNSLLKLKLYRYLSYSMYRLGHYDRSLQIVRKFTLPLSQYFGKKRTYIQLKQLQGVYLYNIGKVKAAKTIYEDVLNEIERQKIDIPKSSFYNNLALAYYKSGQYNKYLNLQFQALENAKQTNNYSHQIEILNNIFIYYRKSNDEKNALSYLEKAQTIAQKENNISDLGTIYISTAAFYREFKNDYKKAVTFLSKAQEILDPKSNKKEYLQILNELAQTFEEQHNFTHALEKHKEIVSLTPDEKNRKHIDALINQAVIYLKIGNLKKAWSFVKLYKSTNLNLLDFQQVVKAKTVEANYLFQTGKSEEALSILSPTIDQIIVRARSSADLKSGFWHVEEEYLDAIDLAVSIHLEEGQPAKATQMLDQLKTINDSRFYQNPLVKSSLLNESELTQYKRLTGQLDATRKRLLTAPEEKQFQIRQQISKLNLKKQTLDKKLTRKTESKSVSIREIQSQLSARDMVMHVTELKDQYYIANITRSDIQMHTVSLDSSLRNLLSGAVQQVATHKTNLDSLYAITTLLGIQNIPERIEKITVIPDSYLYQLPIDILPLNKTSHSYSYGEATYLIEKYNTQYLTSLDEFTSTNTKATADRNPLSYIGYGVSNFNSYRDKNLVPLPFAQREVTSIAEKLTNMAKVETFINEASTKETFQRTAPNARILHMATHSSVSERDPMFSTVYMSKNESTTDETFEDQIFAYELFELNLNNDMIMLNSCESGSGSYIQGTGVMGISRALRYAGAESLVLNLWSVNDMLASDFAIHFYGQLNEGMSKAEALQATKRYFLANKNASPHFWGPYMLIGNAQPIVKPDRTKNLAIASTFIFYFLLMVGLSYLADRNIFFKNEEKKAA